MVDYSALMIYNIGIFDDKIGGKESKISCECQYPTYCPDREADCSTEDLDDDDKGDSLESRTLEKRAGHRPSTLYFREGDFIRWFSLPVY